MPINKTIGHYSMYQWRANVHMNEMNLNLCILRMLEDTFTLGVAQLASLRGMYTSKGNNSERPFRLGTILKAKNWLPYEVLNNREATSYLQKFSPF